MESPFGGMLAMFGGEAALEPLKPNFEAKFQEIIDILNNSSIDKTNITDQMLNQVNELIDKRLDELTPIMVKANYSRNDSITSWLASCLGRYFWCGYRINQHFNLESKPKLAPVISDW